MLLVDAGKDRNAAMHRHGVERIVLAFFAPVTVLAAVVVGLLAAAVAYAEDEALPPRSQWRASSSSDAQQSMEPALAIDGDESTRWGGAFSPGQWLQVDLSRRPRSAAS